MAPPPRTPPPLRGAPTTTFERARRLLLDTREDYDRARAEFRWPELDAFNWARDWFDVFAAQNRKDALVLVRDDVAPRIRGGLPSEEPPLRRTFEELRDRSSRVARGLSDRGVAQGDRILVLLPNVPELWDIWLGAMKLGAVVVPASTQSTRSDLEDRLARGNVRHLVTRGADAERFAGLAFETRIAVGDPVKGFVPFDDLLAAPSSFTAARTKATDPLLLYFTSGTTAKPKLVLHSHASYPVGHLSTMYWIGIQEGDVHQNLSSPGWAKHAWSSLFAPWNAGATILVHDYARFRPARARDVLAAHGVTTFCAPPTVWRMMIADALGDRPTSLRELVSAGEPLNPEVIDAVGRAWGITIRDGFGQTESTAQIGNTPGQPVRAGSMGRPLPGYDVVLVDAAGNERDDEGELALRLGASRPMGLTIGYDDDAERTREMLGGAHYRTGDEARRDADGYYTFVGRGDDVFKSSDYRISPFELESVLVEHPLVVEAAVVPSLDDMRLAVPKAFVTLAAETVPSAAVAKEIFRFATERLAPYKRIRRLEFRELPKTISGKIRRVELRTLDAELRRRGERAEHEHWIDDP